MDNGQIIKAYEEFAADQYAKIRSQCQSYGELQKRIDKAGRDLRWGHGTDLWKMMERLLQKEIDSVLETLPIQDISGNAETLRGKEPIVLNEERKTWANSHSRWRRCCHKNV